VRQLHEGCQQSRFFGAREGTKSTKWMDAQQKHLKSIGKQTTGKRWTIAIVSKLWDIAWDMWQHRNHVTHNTLHHKK
jgi:hypothetical protein